MNPQRIPLDKILKIRDALERACQQLPYDSGGGLWSDLNEARSLVRVHLVPRWHVDIEVEVAPAAPQGEAA